MHSASADPGPWPGVREACATPRPGLVSFLSLLRRLRFVTTARPLSAALQSWQMRGLLLSDNVPRRRGPSAAPGVAPGSSTGPSPRAPGCAPGPGPRQQRLLEPCDARVAVHALLGRERKGPARDPYSELKNSLARKHLCEVRDAKCSVSPYLVAG